MTAKLSLGSVNSTLLKQKKKKEEREQIRRNAYKNLFDLKAKYNLSDQEFIKCIEYSLDRFKY